MKLKKALLFTLVFAALVFCISCKGKDNKYPDMDDDIFTDEDQLPEDDTDTGAESDDDADTTPVNDNNNPSDDPHHDSDNPEEPDDNDTDVPDDTDTEPDDTDTENDDTDTEPDDTDTEKDDTDTEPDETGDEDSIPEKDDPVVVCTDQTQCFNNKQEKSCPTSPDADFFGQDAQYANKGYCLLKSYSTPSDLIVIDNITGLVWQRNLPAEGCPNTINGLTICNKQEAVDYCNNLNYAGESDWRLPTPEEFATIKNFGQGPAIDSEKFPLPSSAKTFRTSRSTSSGKGWVVDFQKGETTDYEKDSEPLYVRCVRGEELEKPNFKIFTEGEDEIVYDYTNNLRWTKVIVDDEGKAKELSWKLALQECENLEYAGESDWRLPNINELASIIDYSRTITPASTFPGLTSSIFTTLTSITLWSSTSYVNGPTKAWVADISSGAVKIYSEKLYKAGVICVH